MKKLSRIKLEGAFGLLLLAGVMASSCVRSDEKPADEKLVTSSQQKRTVPLTKHSVTLSKPILVMRSKGYAWFPTLVKLGNGDLQIVVSHNADAITKDMKGTNVFSRDGGKTWSEPIIAPYSEAALSLPSGDEVFLPYYLSPSKNGVEAPYTTVPKGTHTIKVMPEKLSVTGWPRPLKSPDAATGLAAFNFTGQTVALKAGGYLAMMYGHFEGDKRYSLVALESSDGVKWKFRSVIGSPDAKLPGDEGPCEAALCRLKDGRLMSVFRLGGQYTGFGQSWSEDDGKTWSEPVYMGDVHAVQPSLAVMKDGTVLLTSGRPGLHLYVNEDGSGKTWDSVDLQANHNEFHPDDPIKETTTFNSDTTSYTEIVALDDTHLLIVYDRLGVGWSTIPADSPETNTVWVVPVELMEK